MLTNPKALLIFTRGLPKECDGLPITDYRLPIPDYRLRDYRLPVIGYSSEGIKFRYINQIV